MNCIHNRLKTTRHNKIITSYTEENEENKVTYKEFEYCNLSNL